MNRILVGSPVKQESIVLKEFLIGLDEAKKGDNQLTYFFIDDNTEEESTRLLEEFSKNHSVIIMKGEAIFNASEWEANDYVTHNWQSINFAKVTTYKNKMIEYCIQEKYDYLFLIDSDVIIDRRAILQLLSDDVEIVSNIYWQQCQRNGGLTPQCFWIPDIYIQEKSFNVLYPFEESHKIRMAAFKKLKEPGLHLVDGLGACTMIKRSALEKGVDFTPIYNLKILGEDRPFCIRAGALGISLYVDTNYPAYHLRNTAFLDRVDEFRRDGFKFDMCQIFEPDPPKKKLNAIQRFILRAAKKIVRDLSD